MERFHSPVLCYAETHYMERQNIMVLPAAALRLLLIRMGLDLETCTVLLMVSVHSRG